MDKTIVIAEAGVNHNGDVNLAKKLVDAALYAGADIVKFQSFKAEKITTKIAKKTSYQNKAIGQKINQYEMLKNLELSNKDIKKIYDYCNSLNIEFLSTAFDLESLAFLGNLDLVRYKIPSGEITNLPLIRRICKFKKPIILSTGMATLEEIEIALSNIENEGISRNDIKLLHCTSEYPAPYEDVNLFAMRTLAETFKIKVGYSDHTRGIAVAMAAVALGAEVIEKHLTLDNKMIGPDHKASLEPEEFKEMVTQIRNINIAMGDGVKRVTKSELKNKTLVRKSIVASKFIKKGEKLTERNLTTKRPEDGISPLMWDLILGQIANKDFVEDEFITL